MRYLAIAVLMAGLSVGTAAAAGFDGHWKGGWVGTSSIGGDSRGGCQNYAGNIDMKVANGQVTGQTTGQYSGTISGNVASNGKFNGKIGPYDMSGAFSPRGFKGRFVTSKCAMSVSAKLASG